MGDLAPSNLPSMASPPMQPGLPAPAPVYHDVTVVSTRKIAQARVIGLAPEEFGIERSARSIKEANYCFHDIVTGTEASLISEGYDKEQIKGLSTYTGQTDIETLQRDTVQEHMFSSNELNSASRPIKVTEHYVRLDYEGNGRPCLYQVVTGGDKGEILRKDGQPAITPFDAVPFAAGCPFPMTHRFFGLSMADVVIPIQREKTAMKRGALDNLYLRNNPRVEVSEQHAGKNTLDDLLVSRPGGAIRTKMPGGVNWQEVPDVTTTIYPMLQYLDAERESRTGMSKQSQGIDANALQNQSATAVAQVFSASQMRVKLVARVLAEGVRDMFSLLHGCIRKHGQRAQTVKLRNSWATIDPREWKNRDHMTINVGLGTGGKAQQFAQIMALGNVQKEFVTAGMTNLVGPTELYNTAAEITKIMGHKNPNRFFKDPDAKDPQTGQLLNPPPPPKPDPKTQAIQAQSAANTQATQEKAQLAQFQAQLEAATKKMEAELNAKVKVLEAHIKAASEIRAAKHEDGHHRLAVTKGLVDIISTAHKHDTSMAQGQQAHEQAQEQMKNKPQGENE